MPSPPEVLEFGVDFDGVPATLHVKASQPYILSVALGPVSAPWPAAVDAPWPAAVDVTSTGRHEVHGFTMANMPRETPDRSKDARWAVLELGLFGADGGFEKGSLDDLGVSIAVASFNLPRISPTLVLQIPVAIDGLSIQPIKFVVCTDAHDVQRPLALRGHWADSGAPLPGPSAVPVFVDGKPPPPPLTVAVAEGPKERRGGKRVLSGRELREGAFERVSKMQRELPLPPPLPPPLTPEEAARRANISASLDPDALASAALATSTRSPPPLRPLSPSPPPAPPVPADLEHAFAGLRIAQEVAKAAGAGTPPLPSDSPPPPPERRDRPYHLVYAVSDQRDALQVIIDRTIAELSNRPAPDGRPQPALTSLYELGAILESIRGEEEEPAYPPDPDPDGDLLFASDCLEDPLEANADERPWNPPSEHGEGYVRVVEESLEAMRSAPSASAQAAAAREAAARLCSDALLVSPWVRTAAGRLAFRRALVRIREACASFEPLAMVAKHLRCAALRRLKTQRLSEDAVRNAWDAVEALRPQLYSCAPDMHLITLRAALDILELALKVTENIVLRSGRSSPSDPERCLFYAEALARIGGQEVMDGRMEAGIEHLFDAWSAALRAGSAGSPSRLEARIISLLTEAHGNSPTAFNLASRMYWYRETVEDRQFEARACSLLAMLEIGSGRMEEARQTVDRIFEIYEELDPLERERELLTYRAAGFRLLIALRSGEFVSMFEHARQAVTIILTSSDFAHPAFDTALGGLRNMANFHVAIVKQLEFFRFALYIGTCTEPYCHGPGAFNALCAIAELLVRLGRWRAAAVAMGHALRAGARFPRAYPPDHPRMRRLREALRRCEERAAAAAAALRGSAPSDESPSPSLLSAIKLT